MRKLSLEEYLLRYLPKLEVDETYLFYLISRERGIKEKLGVNIDKVLFRLKTKDPLKTVSILSAIRDNIEFQVRGVRIDKNWIKIMHVLNPINMKKASRNAVSRYVSNCDKEVDIEKIYYSELAKNVDFRMFMLDVDSKNPSIIQQLSGIKARLVLVTKRGFHIHVWKDDLSNPKILFTLKDVEIKTRNSLEYVPFISQGTFTPEAYELNDIMEILNLI
ncbi:hypothetical protein [Sulfolobus acidocaldarius]|uniref:Uncharacterized protein n=4 Tax=Sulfolobus acidocaldarius TaxID=2285 RepID=Q4J9X6_SULAC|nr:hypothetical protein [Sulfolobus acidocaldarius]AAY80403.1 hypothetical protein Saci_1046 [Sulfolobus acidocaldarius DSM 639]